MLGGVSGTTAAFPRRCASLLLVALAGATAGCDAGAPEDEDGVRSTLAELGRATAERDYATICERLLAPAVLVELERMDVSCSEAWRKAYADRSQPRLIVREVRVEGSRARADVRSSATGHEPAQDVIELIRAQGRWKVVSVGGRSAPQGDE